MVKVLDTGELGNNLPSQRWAHSAIAKSTLIVYFKGDRGDHLLMFRSPIKFARIFRSSWNANAPSPKFGS